MDDVYVGDVFVSDNGAISVVTDITPGDFVRISYVCEDMSTIYEWWWLKSGVLRYLKKVEV